MDKLLAAWKQSLYCSAFRVLHHRRKGMVSVVHWAKMYIVRERVLTFFIPFTLNWIDTEKGTMIYLHFKDKNSHESGVAFFKDFSFRIFLAREYMQNNPDLNLIYAYCYFNGRKIYFEEEVKHSFTY